MDPSICLGLRCLCAVPITLLVIGAVELHKLKKTVRQLGRRVGELESEAGGALWSHRLRRVPSHRRPHRHPQFPNLCYL